MRFRRPSVIEAALRVVIGAVLVALLAPPPMWRDAISQSCHLCGNRRIIIRQYRWWRLSSETVEPTAVFPVPDGHVHDWWQYAATHSSSPFGDNRASGKSARYRDRRNAWTPTNDVESADVSGTSQ